MSGTHQTSTMEAGICSDTSHGRPAIYTATSHKTKFFVRSVLCCSSLMFFAYGTKQLHLQEITKINAIT